ncbi:MAG: hypothetical protein QOE11_1110 [Solirubrobacteraceae bacterium]|nr:hypothetical protein [Solirubrobacteraceae bacterium]
MPRPPDAADGAGAGWSQRLRVAHWHALTAGALAVVALVAIGVGLHFVGRQTDLRQELLDHVDPADRAALRLSSALIDQETGVRGYVLSRRREFLAPYTQGRAAERAAVLQLQRLATTQPALRSALLAVTRSAQGWRAAYAQPAIAAAANLGLPLGSGANAAVGKQRFDRIRRALGALQSRIDALTASSRGRLDDAARVVVSAFVAVAAILLLSILAGAVVLRRTVTRPLARLAGSARHVAAGDLERPLGVRGPSDVRALAGDVDVMRTRLVEELAAGERARAALTEGAADLERSNAELEQFAYVVSHDLQEPLRKIAGFCELLGERYGDKLDDRAGTYIRFAVDGARRMQRMIDDLLALSRIGRSAPALEPTDLGALAARARSALSGPIAEAGAEVEIGALPTVPADPAQLAIVFEQLLSNAVAYRSEAAPQIRIEAREEGADWVVCVADNGIGIAPESAERAFAIFGRLQPRSSHEGSGTGLALCRKIVEKHGGRIWLDSEHRPGTRVCFTLPVHADQ